MDANIHKNSARFFFVPFPTIFVPTASRRDVRQTDFRTASRPALRNPLLESDQFRMHPHLQHRVNPAAILRFEVGQRIEIPGIDDQRLLTNGVRP